MTTRLTLRQLNRASLHRQGLAERAEGTVPEAIRSLAGLQAQHANSPYVALWSRRRGQKIIDLEEAIEGRTVVKATLMRTTLHLVSADDYHVLDSATAESRVGAWASTARKAGVDLAELNGLLLEFCSEPRTVAEMEPHLSEWLPDDLADHVPGGVRNPGFRMASAAGGLIHVPPSGLWKSHGRPSYIDARVWLGSERSLDTEAALGAAVERYLAAYGPASEDDITKWAGERRVTRLRAALATIEDRLVHYVDHDGRPLVDLADRVVPDGDEEVPVRFLSRWDSLLIGYHLRNRVLPDEYREAVVKKNGDFLPTFLVDGFVAGLWSVDIVDDRAVLSLTPFRSVPALVRTPLEEEGERLARYIEPEQTRWGIRWNDS